MKTIIVLVCCTLLMTKFAQGRLDDSYYLPETVKPTTYYLSIEPNFETSKFSFNGSVRIDLEILENARSITLHAIELDINKLSIKVVGQNQLEIGVIDIRVDELRQFYIIDLVEELLKGRVYSLSIGEFSAKLRLVNNGFYLGKHEDKDNSSKYFAVSDFEPSDARRAFPCFDSPNMKAKFNIKLIRPCNYISLSNEKLINTNNLDNNRCEDIFKETVVMPTYVVAFIICDFKPTSTNERHRIIARSEDIENGFLDYALLEGVKVLQVLENFTGVPYALSKMDQIAIPDKYFEEEAMENWGLVTFSEQHLFISNSSKTEDYIRCTTYISHEFSHQWFGNLVTAKDWKYIWLSEGFAAYFQYYITSLIKPSWNVLHLYMLNVLHKVLEYDTHDTEPMNYSPKQLGTIPNPWICYLKASAVIRMTQNFLSPQVFQYGLHKYLVKNKFKSVSPSELYEAYQEALIELNRTELLRNVNVSTVLKSWDSNLGFPLITVTRDYNNGLTTINQTRYFENKFSDNESIWFIPITYVFEESLREDSFMDTSADLWLNNRSITIQDNATTDGWIILNKQQTGYYRVNYDVTNWNRIANFLNSENFYKIHPLNRAQLIHEAFHFAKHKYIPYGVALNISRYLVRETNYVATKAFTESLDYIIDLLMSSDVFDVFQTYVIKLLSTAYRYLGFEENSTDSELDKLNRVNIVKWLCTLGHEDCRREAYKKLIRFRQTGINDMPPNLEREILCCALKSASLSDWEFIYNLSKVRNDHHTNIYSNVLGCIEDSTIINRILDLYIVSNDTMSYEERDLLYCILSTPTGISAATDYIKNFDKSLNNIQQEFIYILSSSLINKTQFTKMNIRNRVDENFYLRLNKIAEENISRHNIDQINQLEEWFSNLNNIDDM